jgi:hypothetical protein
MTISAGKVGTTVERSTNFHFSRYGRGGLDPLTSYQVQQWRGVPITISAAMVEEGWTHYHLTRYNSGEEYQLPFQQIW